jgi:hypothetical protein
VLKFRERTESVIKAIQFIIPFIRKRHSLEQMGEDYLEAE